MVGDMDLLVYIVANRKNTLMPTVPATPEAAGRTQPFPNGVLSEVFASRAMDDGKLFGLIGGLFANHPRQGIALANLAFHELAHNKWWGLPEAERKKYNVANRSEDTHLVGGVMGTGLNQGFENLDITPENVNLMATMIQYSVKQFTNKAK